MFDLQLPARRALGMARRTGFVLMLAAFAAGCDEAEEVAEAEARPVRAIEVAETSSAQTVSLAGTIESQVQADMAFRIGGRMVERLVAVGDVVEPGQVLARLDPADQENALQAAEASLAAAEGQQAEARIVFERQRTLYERQIAARAAFDRAEAALISATAAADAARAQVVIAKRRLNDTELLADVAGVVTVQGAEAGEVVTAGRMVVQIARDGGRDAVFDVPAALIDASPQDPQITVSLSQSPGTSVQGRVREVSPRADAATGTFRVRVGLIDAPAEMRLGSVVTGQASFGASTAIELPASALTSVDGAPAVWVVDPASMAVALRQIGVERFTPAAVIVADGLNAGEIVVTAGVQALRPGQIVRRLGDPA